MKRAAISLILSVPLYAQAATPPPSVTLNWTAPVNATGTLTYGVYRANGPCPASGPITPTPPVLQAGITGLTYTDTTVAIGNTYSYTVNTTATVSGVTTVGTTFSNCNTDVVGPATPTLTAVPLPGSIAVTIIPGTNPAGTTYSVLLIAGLCTGSPAFTTVTSGITGLTYAITTGVTNGPYCVGVSATVAGVTSTVGTLQVNVPPPAPVLGSTVTP